MAPPHRNIQEDKEGWLAFLRSLKERGLAGTKLFIGDKKLGLVDAVNTVYPEAKFQRCTVHFYRTVFSVVPRGKVSMISAMLKAIHAQEDRKAADEKSGTRDQLSSQKKRKKKHHYANMLAC